MNTNDLKNAIGLSGARLLILNADGTHPSVETLRRWANPTQGCKPAGRRGPTIYLRSFQHHGYVLTFPEWVQEFERQRQELGAKQMEAAHP